MHPTERLYFRDSRLLEFTGTVIDVRSTDSGDSVVLDRTAFYPTGGGQPNDIGKLGDADVVDVVEDEAGAIYHKVTSAGSLAIGAVVTGKIDPARRLDHLQQHSGQHILSQAFVRACGAETRSFHLGAETSTIDIDWQSPSEELIRAAEDIANAIVFDDRPMIVHLVTEEEADRFPLRKESPVQGEVRIIEVEDFDWSPCGGTHAARTGQVGLIAVRSYERAKKMTRVEFVCGGRALREYRLARDTAFGVARLLSAERENAVELVERAIQDNKALKKRVHELLELAMSAEAGEMLAVADNVGSFKIVHEVFDGRDLEEVRMLAQKIVLRESSIALLATKDAGAVRLVFARSESLAHNMGELVAKACQALGGRGGGRPDLAQGGGPNIERISEVMHDAIESIKAS
jgi:alanyl-tRNA synthetase